MLIQNQMRKFGFFGDLKFFIIAGMGIITFSNIVVQLFGQTIPAVVWAFFKDVGVIFVFIAVFVFAFSWLLKSTLQQQLIIVFQ